jgi:hypothetical protein
LLHPNLSIWPHFCMFQVFLNKSLKVEKVPLSAFWNVCRDHLKKITFEVRNVFTSSTIQTRLQHKETGSQLYCIVHTHVVHYQLHKNYFGDQPKKNGTNNLIRKQPVYKSQKNCQESNLMRSSRSINVLLACSSSRCATAAKISGLKKSLL